MIQVGERRILPPVITKVQNLLHTERLAGPDHVGVSQTVQLRQRGHRSAVGLSERRSATAMSFIIYFH